MINPRAIAVRGIGYGPLSQSVRGYIVLSVAIEGGASKQSDIPYKAGKARFSVTAVVSAVGKLRPVTYGQVVRRTPMVLMLTGTVLPFSGAVAVFSTVGATVRCGKAGEVKSGAVATPVQTDWITTGTAKVTPTGAALARMPDGFRVTVRAGKVAPRGVKNPTDEELLAMARVLLR